MRAWVERLERGPRVIIELGGVEHCLTVDRATTLRDCITAAIVDATTGALCWCGEIATHREWCHGHAPRCRSGAHFYGNCQCVGVKQ